MERKGLGIRAILLNVLYHRRRRYRRHCHMGTVCVSGIDLFLGCIVNPDLWNGWNVCMMYSVVHLYI